MSSSPAGGRNVPFIKDITKKWFKESAKIKMISDENELRKAQI